MARYNEHKCMTCGETFEYCRRCAITPVVYKAEGFCSEKCSNIFAILSKHGCNLISAEETLKELAAYNLDETTLNEGMISHIESLKSEAGVEVEETVIIEEPVVTETTVNTEKSIFQFNKKK